MKLLIVVAGAMILSGCAAGVQPPVSTLAEQKLDRANCKAEAASLQNAHCIVAKSKSKPKVDAFPFEIG